METPGAGSYLWFIAILVMIPLALWLLKRSPLAGPLGASQNSAPMRVISALALAPGQRILTVEVGEGDERRWLVLGVTQQHISTLHVLPPSEATPAAPATPRTDAFSQLLKRIRSGDSREQ
jgi:flagellar protein FliO/FliZ